MFVWLICRWVGCFWLENMICSYGIVYIFSVNIWYSFLFLAYKMRNHLIFYELLYIFYYSIDFDSFLIIWLYSMLLIIFYLFDKKFYLINYYIIMLRKNLFLLLYLNNRNNVIYYNTNHICNNYSIYIFGIWKVYHNSIYSIYIYMHYKKIDILKKSSIFFMFNEYNQSSNN